MKSPEASTLFKQTLLNPEQDICLIKMVIEYTTQPVFGIFAELPDRQIAAMLSG